MIFPWLYWLQDVGTAPLGRALPRIAPSQALAEEVIICNMLDLIVVSHLINQAMPASPISFN